MTKQTKWVCSQRRLSLAWASTQSDQSLRCPHEESLGPYHPLSAQRRIWSDWADAQADLSVGWAHMPFCWFCHVAAHFPVNTVKGIPESRDSKDPRLTLESKPPSALGSYMTQSDQSTTVHPRAPFWFPTTSKLQSQTREWRKNVLWFWHFQNSKN